MKNRTAYLNASILVLTGLVLAGCSGTTYDQVNDRDEVNYHDVVRDMEGQFVHSSNGNCVRTQWLTDRDLCASPRMAHQTIKQRQETHTVAGLSQEERTVYFQFDRATLSPEARERLDTLANTLKSDQSVKEAKIVGYADRIGSVSYNDRLSQNRAESVRDYLIANGYTNARVTETRWVGKSEPSANCPVEARAQLIECLQKDRRVEVEIEYRPEGQMPDAR